MASKQVSAILIPGYVRDPGFDATREVFDASSKVYLRSSLSTTHAAVIAATFP